MKKRILIMAVTVLTACSITSCKSTDYKKASELYENENYKQSAELFETLGNYKDSEEKVLMSKYSEAKALAEAGEYEQAEALFTELGDYEDCADMVKECEYQTAKNLYDNGNFESAEAILSELGEWKDSTELLRGCKYQTAQKYFNENNYESAKTIFYELNNYKDSSSMLERCNGKIADQLFEEGDYEGAIKMYESAGTENKSNIRKAKMKLMEEQYPDVIKALQDAEWYFESGSTNVVKKIHFDSQASIDSAYIDGNGISPMDSEKCDYLIDDSTITVYISNEETLELPYKLKKKITIDKKGFFTPKQVLDSLLGFWKYESVGQYDNAAVQALFGGNRRESRIHVMKDKIKREKANQSAYDSSQYFYFDKGESNYELGFGEFRIGVDDGELWFFNIINGEPVMMYYDHVAERTDKLLGNNYWHLCK